jgi:phage baseplate assembly protein W
MYPQNLHWQLRVSPGPVAAWGEAVTGIEDLEQTMRIICLTPKLSVPTEPEKFCDALNYIDRPPAIAIPGISREIWDSLTRWEPRITVERVEVQAVAFHHFKAPVFWRPTEDVLSEIRRTDIDLREAA